jgi:phosphatidylinositol-3-phosphatase
MSKLMEFRLGLSNGALSWFAKASASVLLLLTIQALPAAEKNIPRPDHVVVAIMENHSFEQIMHLDRAPFIYGLASGGALFGNSFAVAHPSQPNYFVLFSGSTQNVTDNKYHWLDAPTLAGALSAAHLSFVGYAERGSPRKHNPWESFADSRAVERSMTEFPNDFTRLPAVSFVVPNLDHDMHDGSVREGDTWLRVHLGVYAGWAKTHNSLLIVTFDEDNDDAGNHIPTIFFGAHVRPGRYDERITHYSVIRTLLEMYNLTPIADVATIPPIRAIWDEE